MNLTRQTVSTYMARGEKKTKREKNSLCSMYEYMTGALVVQQYFVHMHIYTELRLKVHIPYHSLSIDSEV